MRALHIFLMTLMASLLVSIQVTAHPDTGVRIRQVSRRIAENPADAGLNLQRGELHRVHGSWDKARADFHRARKLRPGWAVVDFCLGRMWWEAGRPASPPP